MAGKGSWRKRKKAVYRAEDFLSSGRMYSGTGIRDPLRKEKKEAKSKKNPTKLQKLLASTKRAKQRRTAKALREFLKQQNPSARYAGARIRRNKGSITIIPIKLSRKASR